MKSHSDRLGSEYDLLVGQNGSQGHVSFEPFPRLPVEIRLLIWKFAIACYATEIVELPLKRKLPTLSLATVNKEAYDQLVEICTVLQLGPRKPIVKLDAIWLKDQDQIYPIERYRTVISQSIPYIQKLAITARNWETARGIRSDKTLSKDFWDMIVNIKEIAIVVGFACAWHSPLHIPTGESRQLQPPCHLPREFPGLHRRFTLQTRIWEGLEELSSDWLKERWLSYQEVCNTAGTEVNTGSNTSHIKFWSHSPSKTIMHTLS